MIFASLIPHPAPGLITSSQLPLSVLLGEFQRLCFLGRAVWSCLASLWCLPPGVPSGYSRPLDGLLWDVWEREGSNYLLKLRLSSQSSEAYSGLPPCPLWPVCEQEGGAYSGPAEWTGGPEEGGRGQGLAVALVPSLSLPYSSLRGHCSLPLSVGLALFSRRLVGSLSSHFISSCLGHPPTPVQLYQLALRLQK